MDPIASIKSYEPAAVFPADRAASEPGYTNIRVPAQVAQIRGLLYYAFIPLEQKVRVASVPGPYPYFDSVSIIHPLRRNLHVANQRLACPQ